MYSEINFQFNPTGYIVFKLSVSDIYEFYPSKIDRLIKNTKLSFESIFVTIYKPYLKVNSVARYF